MIDENKTKIIALDETGRFEWKDNKDFRCIGGVVAEVTNIRDAYNDIIDFYKELCSEYSKKNLPGNVEVRFPESMHGSNIVFFNVNNSVKNWDDKKYKKAFRKELQTKTIEYLRAHDYRIYAYIYPYPEIRKEDDLIKTNITDMYVGANLYEELAISAVENLMFYDGAGFIPKVSVNAATRTIYDADDPELRSEYEKLYSWTEDHNGKRRYYITNTNVFKTALNHKLNTDDNWPEMDISLNVKSINYDQAANDSELYELAFHYMADIVTGYVRYQFDGCSESTKDMIQKARELNSTDSVFDIRFFSKEDRLFRRMLDCLHSAKISEYYSLKYDLQQMRKGENSLGAYYYDTFVPAADGKLSELLNTDAKYSNEIISKLQDYYDHADGMMGRVSNEYQKGNYIAEQILEMVIKPLDETGSFRSKAYRDKFIFRFADIRIRGNNHLGLYLATIKLIEDCEKCKYAVGIEEYLEHKQRTVQIYFNSFNYMRIVEEYVSKIVGRLKDDGSWENAKIEELKELVLDMADERYSNKEYVKYPLAGKIYSTAGQALAFIRSENAEVYFRKALDEFEGDEGNQHITYSYMLHHFIDMQKKDKFEAEFDKFFDILKSEVAVESLKQQFDLLIDYLKNRPSSPVRFDMYLFIKAITVLYSDMADEAIEHEGVSLAEYIADNMKKLTEKMVKASDQSADLYHPYELIHMNVFELVSNSNMDNKNKKRYKKFFMERIVSEDLEMICGPTITAFILNFKLKNLEGAFEAMNDIEKKALDELNPEARMDSKKLMEYLKEKLVYMYC